MYARQLVILLSLLTGTAVSLSCFAGERNVDWHLSPCENGEQLCYKTITGSGSSLNENYGCDNSNICANIAKRGNCFNMTGTSTCCCNNDLCNTPSQVSTMASLPLVFITLFGLLFVLV